MVHIFVACVKLHCEIFSNQIKKPPDCYRTSPGALISGILIKSEIADNNYLSKALDFCF